MEIKNYFDTNYSLKDTMLHRKFKDYDQIAKDFGVRPERDYDNPNNVYAVNRLGLAIYLSFKRDEKAKKLLPLMEKDDFVIFKNGAVYDSVTRKFKYDIYVHGIVVKDWMSHTKHELHFIGEKGNGFFYTF